MARCAIRAAFSGATISPCAVGLSEAFPPATTRTETSQRDVPATLNRYAADGRMSETSNMKDHVYKLIELTGTSTTSVEDAVSRAIRRAHKTVKNLCWFQVVETRGGINKGKVEHWQVTIKVGFTVED
jgi:flavin-binding protein dodecin